MIMLENRYKESDRMFDVICDEPALLQMMCRFGIPLGVADKSVKEVCSEHNVHVLTFLAVANFIKHGEDTANYFIEKVSVAALVDYLRQAHHYFLNFQLPSIRRKLLEAIDCSTRTDVAYLIMKFYDEYFSEVRRHMQHENKRIFTYVGSLLDGNRLSGFEIRQFARGHASIDEKLQELKNIIIKYHSPTDKDDLLHTVLFDIFNCEKDLRIHCEVEDLLFIPAVQILESSVSFSSANLSEGAESNTEMLSEREREIVSAIVRGLTNKQIADTLYISVNTVLTHRKNISRKLNIRSVSGLTIYAIVNKIVDINELNADVMNS